MPTRAKSKKPPIASRRKRVLHALYLAQPFLQFFALMAVLFVLGRCSPLSPSTDKSANRSSSNGVVSNHASEKGDHLAEEEDIKRLLKDVGNPEELPMISQSDFAKRLLPNSIEAEKGADIAGVQNLFRLRAKQSGLQRNVRVLIVHLLKDQKEAFFKGELVRLNLVDLLGPHMNAEARKEFFGDLDKVMRDVAGKAYLVLSDDDMSAPDAASALPVPAKLQLAISADNEKAWLQISRLPKEIDDQQQKLIESSKAKSVAMALVLE